MSTTSSWWTLRPAVASDLPLILDSWRASLFKSAPAPRVQWGEFYEQFKEASASLLARADTTVAVATNSPTEIIGYALREGRVLHWVYVKSIYRKQGVALDLTAGCDVRSTAVPSNRSARTLCQALPLNQLLLVTPPRAY